MLHLAYSTAIHLLLERISEENSFDDSFLKYNLSLPETLFYTNSLKEKFFQSNSLFRWTNTLTKENVNKWITLHKSISENINDESIVRKNQSYRASFSISGEYYEIVTNLDLVGNSNKIIAANALREGYGVKGGIESIDIECPSGQIRSIDKYSCNCKDFYKNISNRYPCIHFLLGQMFLVNRSSFLIKFDN